MNKYEPARRKLCQWCRLVDNLIQNFNILFLGRKPEIETVCFENPELNLNNQYSSRTVVFVTLLSAQSLCVSIYCTQSAQ